MTKVKRAEVRVGAVGFDLHEDIPGQQRKGRHDGRKARAPVANRRETQEYHPDKPMSAYTGEPGQPGVGHFRLDLGVGPGGASLDGYAHPQSHHHGHAHDAGPAAAGLADAYRLQVPAAAPPPAPTGRRRRRADTGDGGNTGGQFGILAPTTVPDAAAVNASLLHEAHGRPHAAPVADMGHDTGLRTGGKLSGRIVVDPPDLQAWREKLFNVNDLIILTNEQFEVYFPHVDNVYSHRSTQRYKRKPFVSHYWDCRMKGRPPGTPKTDDPAKKRRKRVARERDLCDVKIRIIEYFPGAYLDSNTAAAVAAAVATGTPGVVAAGGGTATAPSTVVPEGQRFWAIQRVNGNGGNGKGDGIAGPHRHTLQRSDEIKKNSVQRWLAERDKEAKKTQKLPVRKATGAALATVKKHTKDSDLKLYAACFWYAQLQSVLAPALALTIVHTASPFSQRVWIALEAKGLAYQYCETDPYRRPAPTALLEANPRGLVPAIRQGEWACAESAVILEYATDLGQQSVATEHLQGHITSLVLAADERGPYFLGSSLSLVDVHFAPFALRLSRVLRPLRGWADPVPGTRWQRWLDALESDRHVGATTSLDDVYTETTSVIARHPPPLLSHASRP
ncbi:glutathione transferase [Purpureocillium lavendulum]|uniref:Glutathione transferase n=1 Tax=Purpureocillium lavendulum TaxID=1247861 RepID=A0AB34G3V9_9HYPO|nr:glutathione transferase [Purpureocillium lavendulum]